MWYIIIALILVVGLYGFNRTYKTTKSENQNVLNTDYQDIPQDPLIKGNYSKKDLEEKLQRLAKVPPPENLAYGAKCYKVALPPETAHYVCPDCGHKTVYKSERSNYADREITRVLHKELHTCRRTVKEIEGLNVILDESEFCKKCSPDIEKPQLCLKVNIAGTTDTNRICNIDSDDMRLIHEFLEDELVHKGNTDNETPLKNYITRIEELIGVKLKQ